METDNVVFYESYMDVACRNCGKLFRALPYEEVDNIMQAHYESEHLPESEQDGF